MRQGRSYDKSVTPSDSDDIFGRAMSGQRRHRCLDNGAAAVALKHKKDQHALRAAAAVAQAEAAAALVKGSDLGSASKHNNSVPAMPACSPSGSIIGRSIATCIPWSVVDKKLAASLRRARMWAASAGANVGSKRRRDARVCRPWSYDSRASVDVVA